MRSNIVFVSVAAAALLSSAPDAFAGFADATAEAGISPAQAPARAAEAPAAGAAIDVNGDGWPDFVSARAGDAPALYLNQRDGTFAEQSVARGLAVAKGAASFAAGDFDNDGDQDILAAAADGGTFFMLVNDGEGNFSDEAAVRVPAMSPKGGAGAKGFSISLVDYDLDGFLDIYLGSWASGDGRSSLWRNRGDEAPGVFEDATAMAGLSGVAGGTFASAWGDFDGDIWPDLMAVAEGATATYWSEGGGMYAAGEASSGAGLGGESRGVAVADFDGDGMLDVFVSADPGSMSSGQLYKNLGGRAFGEPARGAGLNGAGSAWGAASLDFDNDGDFDLVLASGAKSLLLNDGRGGFSDDTARSGIGDAALGKTVIVLDYDRDGDEDAIALTSSGAPILYRNDAADNGNDWIQLTLEGTVSNRDGIGATVRVVDAGVSRMLLRNPTNAGLGQREAALHFGLGRSDGVVDQIVVTWPNGSRQVLSNQEANTVLRIVEPAELAAPPRFLSQPEDGLVIDLGKPLILSVDVVGEDGALFIWEKDGVPLTGADASKLLIRRFSPLDAGVYRVSASNAAGAVFSKEADVRLSFQADRHSVARWWNEIQLEAVRRDFPDPPYVARSLYHTSIAMWDAFWAYEEGGWTRAMPVASKEMVDPAAWGGDREAAQRVAISHAVYRVLMDRYATSPGKDRSLPEFRWLMKQMGCDPDFRGIFGTSPAEVGNRIGQAVIEMSRHDGSAEATMGYVPVNQPMVYDTPGTTMVDPNRWQPLDLPISITKNGIVRGAETQRFLTPGWRRVQPFALTLPENPMVDIPIDPGPPPYFGTETEREFIAQVTEMIECSAMLDPDDGAMLDISPAVFLNNRPGTFESRGRALNPVTGKPYAPNVVKRGDFWRLVAEYFSDGPGVEGPPGVWNMMHNLVTDHPLFERRLAGSGPLLSPLEWDVTAYLTLNGALHDAAIATWAIKDQYDYARPMSIVRYLAGLGQSTDPDAPSYHKSGLPLRPGLIELVTEESSAPGQRHEKLADSVGKLAVRSWMGIPKNQLAEYSGADWMLGIKWVPYHQKTFPTPNFAGYVSGHTVFSRTCAEVMTLLSGSPFFPGGLMEFKFKTNEFLRVEEGPSSDLAIQCATYYDMADLTGKARMFCGVHVVADDLPGRPVGSRVGSEAFLKALSMRSGAARSEEATPMPRVARGPIDKGRPVSLAFEIADDEPTMILARGDAAGLDQPPTLSVFKVEPGRDTLIASNQGWREGELFSLSQALAARTQAPAALDDGESAIPALLAKGSYRIELLADEGAADASLQVAILR